MPLITGGQGQGEGGGAGFALGPLDNYFGATSGDYDNPGSVAPAANRAAAEAVRDAFAGANPAWLAEYDADVNLTIFLSFTSGGNTTFVAQGRSNSAWVDKDLIIAVQGMDGAPGATGNSFFFASFSAATDFFNTGNNLQLLVHDLPIVTGENRTVTFWTWQGVTNPPSFEPGLFRPSTIQIEGLGIFLAENQLVNGLRNLTHVRSNGLNNILPQQSYTQTGSGNAELFIFGGVVQDDALVASGETLSGTLSTFLPINSNMILTMFRMNPTATGTFVVRVFEGSDNSGLPFYENEFTVTSTGMQNFPTGRPVILTNGDTVFIEIITGPVTFDGGMQATGTDFPTLSIFSHVYTTHRILAGSDSSLSDNDFFVRGQTAIAFNDREDPYIPVDSQTFVAIVTAFPFNNGRLEMEDIQLNGWMSNSDTGSMDIEVRGAGTSTVYYSGTLPNVLTPNTVIELTEQTAMPAASTSTVLLSVFARVGSSGGMDEGRIGSLALNHRVR